MQGLYKDTLDNRHQLDHWEKKILDQFVKKVTDKNKPFPCIPATIGVSLNQMRFGFVGGPKEQSTVEELAGLLRQYTDIARELGKYTSLIIFYKPLDEKNYTVEEYEELFWQQLNGLAAVDESDWPADIPYNPSEPLWEFCFTGERYFMYCASPAHVKRRSRHFQTMMLAITPRWAFKEFFESIPHADKIKKKIRKRLGNYDVVPIHPSLKVYGKNDNFEWEQYFLRDDHTSLKECPFHKFRDT
ncbi:YqcI/YcgG family protein [Virgibacillus kekensis]|uniref:YqcI/YcgG family protein n=1 Tax=Virgibacillus kekensis TaxID=202261 RepID=A0ABV9DME3_9BACI